MDENNSNYNNYHNDNFDRNNRPDNQTSFRTKVIVGISAAMVIGMVGGGVWKMTSLTNSGAGMPKTEFEKQLANDMYVNKDPLKETQVLTSVELDNDVTAVIEESMPSIVSITSEVEMNGSSVFGQPYNKVQQGAGSGFLLGEDKTSYYIATNNHVVADAKTITVTFNDDKDVKGTVKGQDTTGDLAVVVVKKKDVEESTKKVIKVAKLGDSNSVKVGDTVVAIGNALGLGQSCTVGVISALDRDVRISNTKMKLVQTDAAINGGNSGGALLSLDGEVVGINSAKFVEKAVEGMGFAIPISRAQEILKELMNSQDVPEGKQGYLGLSGITITEEDSETYKIPEGVYVREVPKGGAAYKAGVQVGDVITKMNGVGVASIQALQLRANSYTAGTKVTLTVERYKNGEYKEVQLKLTLMSSEDFGKLEYSQNTQNSQNEEPEEQQPEDGYQGNQDEDMQRFYDYFRKYFGDN